MLIEYEYSWFSAKPILVGRLDVGGVGLESKKFKS
jgi:hypothetical protein